MNKTKIDWCDSTWNPVTGCFHDCEYCYARGIAERFGGKQKYANIFEENEPVIGTDGKALAYPHSFCPTFLRYRLKEKQRRLSARWYRQHHPLEEKTCGCCGKTFLPQRRNQEYCTPECRGLNRKSGVQQSEHRRPEGQQSGGIVEINRIAREQGLTYGKLVAKMYAGQVRIGRQVF